jgi:hypothetical protein
MSLNQDDITNLERGIDAALNTIIGMAQQAMVKANADSPVKAQAFLGFLQAINEHRAALANKCLQEALLAHPDLEQSTIGMEEGKEGQ